ncbi:MAG TPA: hypothetical protein VNO30_02440 [Kofleriaceae bacterium]|nr:hypothetical protein [Kofleriaceae bacterium]
MAGQCTEVTYDLTVTVEGNGAGAVSSMSGSMSGDGACAFGACTRSFLEGTRVELAAEASAGAFLGWAQECRGPGSCAMVMDRDRAATALFGTPGHPRWVKQVGGTGWDGGSGVAVDGDENVIAVGVFSGSLQIGDFTLTSTGYSDVFVIKLNGLTGDVIWAKHFGGLQSTGRLGNTAGGRAVRIDASNNIYVMGYFAGGIDFGGGELRSAGLDVFVLKLTAGGDHVWSRQFGGAGSEEGEALAVRGNAIAFVGRQSATTSYYSYMFVVRMTTDGELIWSKSLGGANYVHGHDVALDSSENVLVVGEFRQTVDFGGGTLVASDSDVFIAKYAGPTGTHLFSKRYGGMQGDAAISVAVDSSDNIVVAGNFCGAVDFGGPVPLGVASERNIFVAKYTLAGAHLWAKSFRSSGTGDQSTKSLAVDGMGDVVLTGEFCGTISFGGAEMSAAGECFGIFDIFAVRLANANGSHVSSVRAGSRVRLVHIALAVDGRLYLVGDFIDFAELGGKSVTPVGVTDGYILALAPL